MVIKTIDGVVFDFNLNDLIDSKVYKDGFFEWRVRVVMNRLVKDGMTCMDIGASMGCYALRMAKMVGDGGKVIAFEPMSYSFRKLWRNATLNPQLNVKLERLALSNITEKKKIYFKNVFSADDMLRANEDGMEEIQFTTLDRYVEENKINKIDFIKIDVDGYELKILQGAINTIKRFKPIMIVEFGQRYLKKYGDKLGDLVNLLVSLGYSFFEPEENKKLTKQELLDYCKVETRDILCKAVI